MNDSVNKRIKMIHFKRKIKSTKENHAQMITLMGIVIAVSVFVVSSIAAEVENIEFITSETQSSLTNEFSIIKETFGTSLNYELIHITIGLGAPNDNECVMRGNINNITQAFNQTRKGHFDLELKYGRIFDAKLNKYWYANTEDGVYYVHVTLYLEDADACLSEDVTYSIVCKNL